MGAERIFVLISYFSPFFFQQVVYFCRRDAGAFGLVIDVEQIYFRLFHRKNHGERDDSGSAAFALSFRSDTHADFAQSASEVGAEGGIGMKFFKQSGVIIREGGIMLFQSFGFTHERWQGFDFTFHFSILLRILQQR